MSNDAERCLNTYTGRDSQSVPKTATTIILSFYVNASVQLDVSLYLF